MQAEVIHHNRHIVITERRKDGTLAKGVYVGYATVAEAKREFRSMFPYERPERRGNW